jgi:hypothetical protein
MSAIRTLSYVNAIDYALSLMAPLDPEQIAIEPAAEGKEPITVAQVVEKLTALREVQVKRSGKKSDAPTKAQVERAALAERVLAAMKPDKAYGTAEIAALLPELAGATPQRVTPLMKLLGERVAVSKVKGKAVYSIA